MNPEYILWAIPALILGLAIRDAIRNRPPRPAPLDRPVEDAETAEADDHREAA